MKKSIIDINKRIFILTGASGRLGKAYIPQFIDNGSQIVCIDVEKKGLESIKKKFKDKVITFNCSVTNKNKLEKISSKLKEDNININGLINNAAGKQTTVFNNKVVNFENYPLSAWMDEIQIDLTGTFLCSQIFSRNFVLKKTASIVNLSSTYGIVAADQRIYGKSGLNSSAAYATSKAGLIGLTKYLASYWQGKKIRVNALAPAGVFNNQDSKFYKKYIYKTMLKRMASSEDLFTAIAYLLSDQSSFVTGTTLVVDGGFTAW